MLVFPFYFTIIVRPILLFLSDSNIPLRRWNVVSCGQNTNLKLWNSCGRIDRIVWTNRPDTTVHNLVPISEWCAP